MKIKSIFGGWGGGVGAAFYTGFLQDMIFVTIISCLKALNGVCMRVFAVIVVWEADEEYLLLNEFIEDLSQGTRLRKQLAHAPVQTPCWWLLLEIMIQENIRVEEENDKFMKIQKLLVTTILVR